jgi:RimJ/RimL family protein N-acetyltransferase
MNWPDEQPVLQTKRLVLRAPVPDDAPVVQRIVSTMDIAATVSSIPHPYPDGAATEWINKTASNFREKAGMNFLMALRDAWEIVGCIGLHMKPDPFTGVAEIGYWVSVPHWGRGYATEAAEAMLRFGFESLGLRRMEAHHMSGNPASGRVLTRIGMQREGALRERVSRFGVIHDLVAFGILRSEYDARRNVR